MAAYSTYGAPTPNIACWQLAIKIFNTKLTKDPKKLIQSSVVSVHQPHSPYQDLIRTAEKAKSCATARQSAFRSAMESLLLTIHQYAAVIDVLIQQQPDITSLVWGFMRTMILIAVKEVQLSEEIGNSLVKVVYEVGRWEQFLQLFPDSKRLHSTAAELFAQLINYLVRASNYYQMSYACRLAKCGFTSAPSKLRFVLHEIDRLSGQFDRETWLASNETLGSDRKISEAQRQDLKAESREQDEFREESRRYMLNGTVRQKQLRDTVANLHSTLVDSVSVRERTEQARLVGTQRRSVLSWLRFAASPSTAFSEWEEGTCQWIFHHPSYLQWKMNAAAGILWIHGIPGCGKSVIASFLSQNSNTPIVLTHFFRVSVDERSVKPNSLAASLLAQTLQHTHVTSGQILQAAISHSVTLLDMASSWEDCRFAHLWAVLERVLALLPKFTVIVDGLDECRTTDDCAEILQHLHAMAAWPNAHVIVSSRLNDAFKGSLRGAVELAMNADTVSGDILHYVKEELRRTPRLRFVEAQIMVKTKNSAGGMFLWARMLLANMMLAPTPRIQLEHLERFPSGLSEIYDNFLEESAILLDVHELDIQRSIFMLLVAAARPLSIEEIAVSLALTSPGRHPQELDLLLEPRREIQRLCWPLVSTHGDHASLIHASVSEYFVQAQSAQTRRGIHFSTMDCQSFLACKCLFRVLHEDLTSLNLLESLMKTNVLGSSPEALQSLDKSPDWTFLSYAYHYWYTHLAQTSTDSAVVSLVAKFLHNRQFVTWFETLSLCSDRVGPVLEARASLKSWYRTLQPGSQAQVAIDDFFIQPYADLCRTTKHDKQDSLVSCLALQRLATYYDAAGVPPKDKSRLHLRHEIVEGFRHTLGPTDRITLRSETEHAVGLLTEWQYVEGESRLLQNAVLQAQHYGEHVPDSFISRSWAAFAMHCQRRHEEAEQHQALASDGLLRTTCRTSREYMKARLWFGWSIEAMGDTGRACEIYESTWKTCTSLRGADDAVAVFCQCSMGIALRKLGDCAGSEKHLLDVLERRTRIFGQDSFLTIDTATNLAVLYFESDRLAEAEAHLRPVSTASADRVLLERACQVAHIKALVAIRQHDFGRAEAMLQAALQSDSGTEPYDDVGERLWMRLTLANLYRRRGSRDAAVALFSALAVPLHDGQRESGITHVPGNLHVVEAALRHAKHNEYLKADAALQECGLTWRKKEMFWNFPGGPSTDTPDLPSDMFHV